MPASPAGSRRNGVVFLRPAGHGGPRAREMPATGKGRGRGSSIRAGRDRAGCSPSSRASLPPSSREVNALTCPAAAPEGNAGLQSPPSTGEAASSMPKGNQARKASPQESAAEHHGARAPPCPSIQQVKRSKKILQEIIKKKKKKKGAGPSPHWPAPVPSHPLAREARGEQRQPAGCGTATGKQVSPRAKVTATGRVVPSMAALPKTKPPFGTPCP